MLLAAPLVVAFPQTIRLRSVGVPAELIPAPFVGAVLSASVQLTTTGEQLDPMYRPAPNPLETVVFEAISRLIRSGELPEPSRIPAPFSSVTVLF